MWPRIITMLLGVWLMVAPSALGYGDPARTNDQIVGPVVAASAVIAISEATRPLRWVNVALGIWLLVAPWILGYGDTGLTLHSFAVGTPLALLAAVRGPLTEKLGGGWTALWRSDSTDKEEALDS